MATSTNFMYSAKHSSGSIRGNKSFKFFYKNYAGYISSPLSQGFHCFRSHSEFEEVFRNILEFQPLASNIHVMQASLTPPLAHANKLPVITQTGQIRDKWTIQSWLTAHTTLNGGIFAEITFCLFELDCFQSTEDFVWSDKCLLLNCILAKTNNTLDKKRLNRLARKEN